MPFVKGKKHPRQGGRQNPPGGRPTKLQQEVKKLAADMVKKYIEDRLKPVVDAYLASATGKRHGDHRRKFDSATNRHVIERFLGPAPRTVTLDLAETIESFFEKVQEEGGEQGKPGEKKRGDQ